MLPCPNSAPDSLTPSHSRAPVPDTLAALEEELETAEVVPVVAAVVDKGLDVATLAEIASVVGAELPARAVETATLLDDDREAEVGVAVNLVSILRKRLEGLNEVTNDC